MRGKREIFNGRYQDLEQEACDQEQKESQESITSFLHEHTCVYFPVY